MRRPNVPGTFRGRVGGLLRRPPFGLLLCLLLGLVLGLPFATSADSAEKTRWIHVRVEDGGDDGETVRINLPVNLVDGVVTLLEEHARKHEDRSSHFRIDKEDIDREEMRRVLAQLRDLPEGAEVVVEKDGDEAWFSREGGQLHIRVEDEDDDSEVRIRLPMKMVEALAASEDADLAQALRALDEDGEILVEDSEDQSTVRIWIDDKSGSE